MLRYAQIRIYLFYIIGVQFVIVHTSRVSIAHYAGSGCTIDRRGRGGFWHARWNTVCCRAFRWDKHGCPKRCYRACRCGFCRACG